MAIMGNVGNQAAPMAQPAQPLGANAMAAQPTQGIMGSLYGGGAQQGAATPQAATSPVQQSAADQYAALTRSQWSDYMSNYVPVENQLIQYASDPTQVTKAQQQGISDAQQQFQAQQGTTQRRLQGYGIQLSPEEKASADRESNLSESLGEVQAANQAGRAVRTRQLSIMGAPAPQAGAS